MVEPIIHRSNPLKVIEFNQKAMSDFEKIYRTVFNQEKIEATISNLREYIKSAETDEDKTRVENDVFYNIMERGKTITLTLSVQDPYFASLLFAIMYGKSDVDAGPLWLCGCNIESMAFSGAAILSEQEQNILIMASQIIKQRFDPNNTIKENG